MKFFVLVVSLFFSFFQVASQDKPLVLVPFSSSSPTLDGVEEAVWDQVPAQLIAKNFKDEAPSVAAYWKALWTNTALYVLVSVTDDDHWPSWESGGDWWVYDQVEIYLDINAQLGDGLGPNDKGTGHYQAVPQFLEGMSGVVQTLEESNYRPGGQACYVLDGEDYVFEYRLDFSSFVNGDGTNMSKDAFVGLSEIGFDVTIVDQDEGKTSERHRKVWENAGATDENYLFMDDAGTIQLVMELPKEVVTSTGDAQMISVYPNPAQDQLTIQLPAGQQMDYSVSLVNINGKILREVSRQKGKAEIDITVVPAGLYFVRIQTENGLSFVEKLLVE